MRKRKRAGVIALASICALAGAAAGISQSVAAKSPTKARPAFRHGANAPGGGMGGPGGGPGGGAGGGAVHSVSEELNKAGTAYISVTTDSGTVTAVDSSEGTLTLKEGTSSVTYATPTLTIPSDATVTLDGKTSALSDLASGDKVTVSVSSEGTKVFATDSSFKPSAGMGGGPGGPPSGSWSGSGSASSSGA